MQTLLNFDLIGEDLYSIHGLKKIDGAFLQFLRQHHPELEQQLQQARQKAPDPSQQSTLLIELSVGLEQFLSQLFRIENDVQALLNQHDDYANLAEFKRRIIQKRIIPKYQQHDWQGYSAAYFSDYLSLSAQEIIQAWTILQAHQDQLK